MSRSFESAIVSGDIVIEKGVYVDHLFPATGNIICVNNDLNLMNQTLSNVKIESFTEIQTQDMDMFNYDIANVHTISANQIQPNGATALTIQSNQVSYNNVQIRHVNRIETVGDEQKHIITVPLDTSNATVLVDTKVSSFGSSGLAATFSMVNSYKNVNGTVQAIGQAPVKLKFKDQMAGDVNFSIDSSNVCITVNGVESSNIQWAAVADVCYSNFS
jgi:hypothetical protein